MEENKNLEEILCVGANPNIQVGEYYVDKLARKYGKGYVISDDDEMRFDFYRAMNNLGLENVSDVFRNVMKYSGSIYKRGTNYGR